MGQLTRKFPFISVACFSLALATFANVTSTEAKFSAGYGCGLPELDKLPISRELGHSLTNPPSEDLPRVSYVLRGGCPLQIFNSIVSGLSVDMVHLGFIEGVWYECHRHKSSDKLLAVSTKSNCFVALGDSWPKNSTLERECPAILMGYGSVDTSNSSAITNLISIKSSNSNPAFHNNPLVKFQYLYHGTHLYTTTKPLNVVGG